MAEKLAWLHLITLIAYSSYLHLTITEIPWKVEWKVDTAEMMNWGQFSISELAHDVMIFAIAKDYLVSSLICHFGGLSHYLLNMFLKS